MTLWWDQIDPIILTWGPIWSSWRLIVFFLWRTMKLMPKTKPQEIKPDSAGSIKWDEVAGADEAKAELQEVVDFLRDPERFRELGATVPKGILLHGPPGTGKTLLAKAVANESGAQFFAQSAAELRRDVRRPRRRADPAPVRRGPQALAGDHLHRRDRRRRRPPRLRQQLRARADAQPAAGGDGRLLVRRATSSSSPPPTCSRSSIPRSCAPVASTARSSSRRPTSAAARRSSRSTRATSPSATSTSTIIARQTAGPDRRRPGQHRQRGRDRRRPWPPRDARRRPTSTTRSSASWPACSRAAC